MRIGKKSQPGYVNPRLLDLTNQVFGGWTVMGYAGRNVLGQPTWDCLCSCGTRRAVVGQTLRKGLTNSCGCQLSARVTKAKTKHGGSIKKSRDGDTAKRFNANKPRQEITYRRWLSMKKRCSDTSQEIWPYYGGRGIVVCERWLKFENFLSDMGTCPDGWTLDRIDPNKSYEPDNCRWATWSTQLRARTMMEMCGQCGKKREVCGADGEHRVSFTMAEIETIKDLLGDWGSEYGLRADRGKVAVLCSRLGLEQLAKVLKV